MLRTDFQPAEHGFHFSNNDIEWQFLLPFIRGKNLCGGMMYTALDYYFNRMTIPSQKRPPPVGTVLNEYITDRQMEAHASTIPHFVGANLTWFLDHWFDASIDDHFPTIRTSISRRTPIVVFLIKEGVFHGHHVMAIGCENRAQDARGGGPLIEVYDPNCPDLVSAIHVDFGRKRFELRAPGFVTEGMRGFFVDDGYTLQTPPFIPDPVLPPAIPDPVSPYVVRPGDTLGGLAIRFYGFESRWRDIAEANRWIVGRNPYRLRVGQILTIPDP